MFVIWDGIPGF